jgi:hypothetical protein
MFTSKAGGREKCGFKCAPAGIGRDGGEVVQGEKCGKKNSTGELVFLLNNTVVYE